MSATKIAAIALVVLVQGAEPRALERTEPTYPPLAVAARVEKIVKLSVKVNPNGSVADIMVVDGHPLLNSAALDAVRQWKFAVTPFGGTTDVEVSFKPPVPFNGSVFGKVVDPEGRPLAGVRVTARRVNYRRGLPSWTGSMPAGVTDAGGEYDVQVREAGEYYIVASYEIATGATSNAAASLSPHTFYPGTPDRFAAVPVIVREGPPAVADIRIPRLTTVRLSGKIVVPPLAEPPRGPLVVQLMRIEPRFADESVAGLGVSLEGGLEGGGEIPFELRSVRPGRYRIEATVATGPPNWAYSGNLFIDAGDRDLENLTIPLHRNIEFNGRVVSQNPTARVDGVQIRLSGRSSGSGALFRAEADGRRVRLFNLRADEYRVTVEGLQGNAYVSDLRLGTRSIYSNAIVPVTDRAPEDLQIIVSSGGSVVSGTVQTATRQVTTTFVFLIPDASRRQNPLLYKTAMSNPSGTFQVNGVAPGDYLLLAFENRPPEGAMENAEFIARYEQRGVRLTLREGTRTPDVTVPIIRE
jgi:TonB family protein